MAYSVSKVNSSHSSTVTGSLVLKAGSSRREGALLRELTRVSIVPYLGGTIFSYCLKLIRKVRDEVQVVQFRSDRPKLLLKDQDFLSGYKKE